MVGGGCAGMEAARRLVQRGHRPVLLEKADHLGGLLDPAGDNPLKENVRAYREWAVRMTEKDPDIEIRLNTEATPELIRELAPDALVIAVGSEPIVPELPDIHGDNVVLAEDVDMGKVTCGKRVLVVGAGLTGTETAVALARDGHEVTQIDMLPIAAIDAKGDASNINIGMLRGMAAQTGVRTLECRRLEEIADGCAVCTGPDGETEKIPCDTVVLSLGLRSRSEAVQALQGIVPDTHVIGDCHGVGNITSAVRDAFYAAVNI